MKILFLGDYSNLHACLGKELRSRGHHVDIISDRGGYMDTHSDIYLDRGKGILASFKYLYKIFSLLPQINGYDVVQLINSNFLKLRPGKIKYFFDRIKEQNGAVFLTLAGNDYYFVKACYDAEIFRFSEFKIGKEPTEFTKETPQRMYGWISDQNRRWSEYLYDKIEGAMSVLPEYDMAARPVLGSKLAFTNLPIDLSSLHFSELDLDKPVNLLIGMRGGMEIQKGTKRLLAIAKQLEKENPDRIKAVAVKNLSLNDYLSKMKESHIVLDQVYSYSPATNALQAMALGRIAASGGQPEYYDYIGNPVEHPILSLSPENNDEFIKQQLLDLIDNKAGMESKSRQGRLLVEKNNDVSLVADKFLSHWNKLFL